MWSCLLDVWLAMKLSGPRAFRPVVMTVVAIVVAPFFAAIIITMWSGGLVVGAWRSRSGRGLVVGARRSRSGRGQRGLVVGAQRSCSVARLMARRGSLSDLCGSLVGSAWLAYGLAGSLDGSTWLI